MIHKTFAQKIALSLLALCTLGTVHSVLMHKNGIIIDYQDKAGFNSDARKAGLTHRYIMKIGKSHYLNIKNNTQKAFTIDASFIKNGLYNQEEVNSACHNDLIAHTMFFGILTATGMWICHSFDTEGANRFIMSSLDLGKANSSKCYILTAACGIATAVSLLFLAFDDQPIADLDKKILKLPITLAPGEEIKKMFWPKKDHHDDSVEFDMEAIQEVGIDDQPSIVFDKKSENSAA